MNDFEKRVLSIVVNEPTLMIPKLKMLGNTKHVHSIVNKYLPFRVGIEFEWGVVDYSKCFEIEMTTRGMFNYFPNIDINEARISFKGFKYLPGLYKFLEMLKTDIPFNTGSGIHIHIDTTGYSREFYLNGSFMRYFAIDLAQYTGTYNSISIGDLKHNAFVRTNKPSLEYRFFRMTYNYSELVKWIIMCSYVNSCLKKHANPLESIMDEIYKL